MTHSSHKVLRALLTLSAVILAAAEPAGATAYSNPEEQFFASHINQIKACCEKAPERYLLQDIDFDGKCELLAFSDMGRTVSIFGCGGGKLETLVCDASTRNLRYAEGVIASFEPAGTGGATFESYTFFKESGNPVKFSDLSYESMSDEGRVHECESDGRSVTYEELQKLIPKDAEWMPVSGLYSRYALPVARLEGRSGFSPASSGSYSHEDDHAAGTLVIAGDGKGGAWFNAESVTSRGNFAELTSNGWIPVDGGTLHFVQNDDGMRYVIDIDLYDDCAVVSESYPDGWYPLFGMGASLAGVYLRDMGTLCDGNGYLYKPVSEDGSRLALAPGGRYAGKVTVPTKVKVPGASREYAVERIASNAFSYNNEVTAIEYDKKAIFAQPEAFFGCRAYNADPDDYPSFVFPNPGKHHFVLPLAQDEISSLSELAEYKWVIFKQNVMPAVADGLNLNDGVEGYALDYDKIIGARFGLYGEALLGIRTAFRGYDQHEIEAIVATNDYVGTHRFPSFSRWKFPEAEQSMGREFEARMAGIHGRQVSSSRKVANLREEEGQLALVNFTEVNGKVAYALVWLRGGEMVASYLEQGEVTREADGTAWSPWNLDYDNLDYQIPNVTTIAVDADGNLDIFLVHNTQEGVHGFLLRQKGDRFERIDLCELYRYND